MIPLTPTDILNFGTHGALILVIFWQMKIIQELTVAIRDNTVELRALKVSFEDEIAATGGFSSREN